MKIQLKWFVLAAMVATTATQASPAYAASWYWVPSRITNGSDGRALLTSEPRGLIGTLLSSLGQYYSHTGMFINSGYQIRHNTGDPDTVELVTDSLGIPQRLNGATLLSMQPGIITQSTEDAFGGSGDPEFNYYDYDNGYVNRNAAVLLRRNADDIGGTINFWGAAREMEKYEAFYSFYSYTDLWSTEPDRSDPDHIHVAPDLDKKNMCSGTIAWALWRNGFHIWPLFYSEEVRNAAAPILYSTVRNEAGKAVPGSGVPFIGDILQDLASGTKTRIANQVVNCMAFNDCYNTGDRWRDGVGTGMSISPDNHLPVGYINPLGVAWGVSGYDPNDRYSLWYDSVEPISYSGGYWKRY